FAFGGGSDQYLGLRNGRAHRSVLRWAAQLLEALPTLMPGRCIQDDRHITTLVQLSTGSQLGPQKKLLWFPGNFLRNSPQPRRVVLTPRQDGPAVGAEGYSNNALLML